MFIAFMKKLSPKQLLEKITKEAGPILDWSWSHFVVLEILSVVLEI